jgi:hypothetical protein
LIKRFITMQEHALLRAFNTNNAEGVVYFSDDKESTLKFSELEKNETKNYPN